MGLSWKEVRQADDLEGASRHPALSQLAAVAGVDARVVESDSGLRAVILERSSVESDSALKVQFVPQAIDYHKAGFVVGFQQGASEQSEQLVSLLKHCDLLVVPTDVPIDVPARLEPCGTLAWEQPSGTSSMTLLRNKPVQAGMLSENAPTGQGELDDNLDHREKWFKKRHSGGN
jgi:hypothetical protein